MDEINWKESNGLIWSGGSKSMFVNFQPKEKFFERIYKAIFGQRWRELKKKRKN
jgi:hypothetical protein